MISALFAVQVQIKAKDKKRTVNFKGFTGWDVFFICYIIFSYIYIQVGQMSCRTRL